MDISLKNEELCLLCCSGQCPLNMLDVKEPFGLWKIVCFTSLEITKWDWICDVILLEYSFLSGLFYFLMMAHINLITVLLACIILVQLVKAKKESNLAVVCCSFVVIYCSWKYFACLNLRNWPHAAWSWPFCSWLLARDLT